MLIRTRQSLALALSVAFALAIGATLAHALHQAQAAIDAARAYTEMRDVLAELRLLTYEHLASGNERSRQQWYERLDALRKTAQRETRVLSGEDAHLQRVRTAAEQMASLFAKVPSGNGEPRRSPGDEELIERIGSRLFALSHDLVRSTGALILAGRADVEAAQRRAVLLVLALTLALVALAFANWFVVRRTLLHPVERLLAGAQAVAEGNLGHRVALEPRDEIGQLAAGFNRMTASLQQARAAQEAELDERRRAEDALQRSNGELEQFAYVASHDLQEPLRMVVSYLQLIQKRYQGRLDAEGDEFIAFAVDGALRMRTLIDDLLAYSRVATRARPFETVDCGEALRAALANLQSAIEETGARIECGPLPALPAERTQLVQLFQNLLGNALKFRGAEAPLVRIAAERRGAEWRFTIEDNGIGIAPQYQERIFGLFQRLHTRREFPGTGIGLAICRKIVERHGGALGVESSPGAGTTFHFTLPAQAARTP